MNSKNFIKHGKNKYMLRLYKSDIHQNEIKHTFWKIIQSFFPKQSHFIEKNTKIILPAKKIQNLSDFKKSRKGILSYEESLLFFSQIGDQLERLEKKNLTIPFFSAHDIIVIDEKYFIIVNTDKLFPIDNNHTITISTPIDTKSSRFFSPEVKKIDTLPSKIYFTSGLFSLAKLTTWLLTNDIQIPEQMKKDGHYWNEIVGYDCEQNELCSDILLLGSIYDTKLYWALERCLYRNPHKRFFLII